MAGFLVERTIARTSAGALAHVAESATRAVGELTGTGIPATSIRSIFVPDDKACFLLSEAVSAEAVREPDRTRPWRSSTSPRQSTREAIARRRRDPILNDTRRERHEHDVERRQSAAVQP